MCIRDRDKWFRNPICRGHCPCQNQIYSEFRNKKELLNATYPSSKGTDYSKIWKTTEIPIGIEFAETGHPAGWPVLRLIFRYWKVGDSMTSSSFSKLGNRCSCWNQNLLRLQSQGLRSWGAWVAQSHLHILLLGRGLIDQNWHAFHLISCNHGFHAWFWSRWQDTQTF